MHRAIDQRSVQLFETIANCNKSKFMCENMTLALDSELDKFCAQLQDFPFRCLRPTFLTRILFFFYSPSHGKNNKQWKAISNLFFFS